MDIGKLDVYISTSFLHASEDLKTRAVRLAEEFSGLSPELLKVDITLVDGSSSGQHSTVADISEVKVTSPASWLAGRVSRKQFDHLANDVAQLKTEVERLTGDKDQLKTEVGRLTGDYDQLKTDNFQLKTEVGRLAGDYDQLKTEKQCIALRLAIQDLNSLFTLQSYFSTNRALVKKLKGNNKFRIGASHFLLVDPKASREEGNPLSVPDDDDGRFDTPATLCYKVHLLKEFFLSGQIPQEISEMVGTDVVDAVAKYLKEEVTDAMLAPMKALPEDEKKIVHQESYMTLSAFPTFPRQPKSQRP